MATPVQNFRALLSPSRMKNVINTIPSPRARICLKRNRLDVPRRPVVKRLFRNEENKKAIVSVATKVADNTCKIKLIVENVENGDDDNGNVDIESIEERRNTAIRGEFCRCISVDTPNRQLLLENGLTDVKGHDLMLGRGRFGTVVKAMYKNKPVAVKVINVKQNDLLNEKNAINLSHENIVKTIKVIMKTENFGLIIMEHMEGVKNVQQVLNEAEDMRIPLNLLHILKISIDVCKGIKYCHESSVLHLDIKPKNLLIGYDGKCKLCDFGSSWNTIEDTKKYRFRSTIQYAAPELLQGNTPTSKCDIYSLGITFWQLQSLQCPFNNYNNTEVLIYQIIKTNLRPTHVLNGNPKYERLYENCWLRNPHERPDVDNVIRNLQKILYD